MATYTVNIFSAVSFFIFRPITYLIGNDTPPLEFDCKGCENLYLCVLCVFAVNSYPH